MSDKNAFQAWLKERNVEEVEALVPDMAGAARGKLLPADKCGSGEMKMPEAIFAQTISGDYIVNEGNVEDRDMVIMPDITTLRLVPWLQEPNASVFVDCVSKDGTPINTAPRQVLRNVLALYEAKGWAPIVAPEVEFYLINPQADGNAEVAPPEGRLGRTDTSRQPYSSDQMNDFDPFINDVYSFCEGQGIRIDALSQEMGPAQFEINFLHGDPVTLADHVFLFKRTIREAAIQHEMHATFLAKPVAGEAGSALHINQSVVNIDDDSNIFSTKAGKPSKLFFSFIGGLPIPGMVHIEQPYWFGSDRNLSPGEFARQAARALEEKIEELGVDNVAAFIGEPIQGAGGVIVPPDTYWPEIQRICNEYGILLITDEVITGFGRLGEWFGADYYDVFPDLMPFAKGVTSGYLPLGGVMVADRIAEVLVEQGGEFFHGYTYSGHPVACAVAIENIRIMQREDLIDRVKADIGPYLKQRWDTLGEHPLVGESRMVGLMGALELVASKETLERFEEDRGVGKICRDFLMDNGLVMRAVGDTLVVAPPLILSHEQADELVEKAWKCLDLTQAAI